MAINAVSAVTVVTTHRSNRSRPALKAGTLGDDAGTAGRRSTCMTQLLFEAQAASISTGTIGMMGILSRGALQERAELFFELIECCTQSRSHKLDRRRNHIVGVGKISREKFGHNCRPQC